MADQYCDCGAPYPVRHFCETCWEKREAEIERLRGLLCRLLKKLPHERCDLTTGHCAGCGVIHWGDGLGPEPCKPGCVLQEALKAADAARKET